jgi:4-hydroxy-3-methylbut-2-enyl diphosphate reductase
MVHTSELSWTRIANPKEVVSIGDEIKVFVKAFDREKGRVSLGYKTDETNPWNAFTSNYTVGDVADVTIVSIMPFGAFAQVIPGVDGLIHISQIANKKLATPAEVLNKGDVVKAKILEIDTENKKVSLSVRALLNEEAEASEEVAADAE